MTEFSNSESRGDPPPGRLQSYLPALKLIGIGWFFAAAVLIGVGGGYWLDQQTGWSPIFTLSGVFLAVGTSFYGGYRMIRDALRASRAGGDSTS